MMLNERRSCMEDGESNKAVGDIIVGYAFMAKKMGSMAKIVQDNSSNDKEGSRVVFKPLDLDVPLEQQGPFHVILHKLSEDVMLRHVQPESGRRIHTLEKYVRDHPEVVLVEHPRDIEKIVSRAETCRTLQRLCSSRMDTAVRPPRFVVVDAPPLDRAELATIVAKAPFSYPLICKPIAACGSPGSHQLIVVGNEEGLGLVSGPVVLQEYCNHDAVLFKVYVLGQSIKVFTRPSLPNLGPNARNIAFDSQRPYPSGRDFGNEEEDEEEACKNACGLKAGLVQNGRAEGASSDGPNAAKCTLHGKAVVPAVSEERIRLAAMQLSEAFRLEIFGFDVIVDKATGDLVVVDVNYFPSFKEMTDFPARLRGFLRRKAAAATGANGYHQASPADTEWSDGLGKPPPDPRQA